MKIEGQQTLAFEAVNKTPQSTQAANTTIAASLESDTLTLSNRSVELSRNESNANEVDGVQVVLGRVPPPESEPVGIQTKVGRTPPP